MKKVIIVGAGIAGLAAGVYARKSGFEVTIYESHTIAGGASTSWRRKGYLFEGGMHWLTGSSPKTSIHKIWRETGALTDQVKVYNRDPFFVFEHEGREARLYRDVEKLRSHFCDIAPEDTREINRLCNDIKKFTAINMPVQDLKGLKVEEKSTVSGGQILKMMPALMRMSFYAKQTSSDYAKRFKSPMLRLLVEHLIGGDNCATGTVFTMATLAAGDGGYPEGGSLGMAGRMAKYFQALGGVIEFGQKVDRVAVSGGKACGIVVEGKTIPADAVIVTQDTRVAIDTLFDAPLHESWMDELRKNTKPMLCTFISVGVEADLSDVPESIAFVADRPFACGGQVEKVMSVNNYAGYEGYAPKGCTALTSAIVGDSYEFWKACKENGIYEAEKAKLAQQFIEVIEQRLPQIKGKIAVWDVATPLTYERYLGSYKGSWMSVMATGGGMRSYPCKAESIGALYFAGQRLMSPGGLPVAAETGRRAAQHLCLDADVVFKGKG